MDHVGSPRSQGTRTGYRYWKCRCDECKAWNTNYQKKYWAGRIAAGRGVRPNGWGGYNNRREVLYQ